jgi:hypothetical protein
LFTCLLSSPKVNYKACIVTYRPLLGNGLINTLPRRPILGKHPVAR